MTASRTALGLLSLSTTLALGCLGPELTFGGGAGGAGPTTAVGPTGTTTSTVGPGGGGSVTSAGGEGGSGSTTGPGSGGGGGTVCTIPSDCPPSSSPCVVPTCVGGQCGTEDMLEGTELPPSDQVAGDCRVAACDAQGGVVGLVDDDDLPEDFNDCTIDTCSSGEPSNDPRPLDTPCGAGGALFCDGAGQCVGCTDPGQCAGTDDDCKARTCEIGVCGVDFTADGVPISIQDPGNCRVIVCDGSGNETEEIDDGDVDDDGLECTIESCSGGVPGSGNVETGIPCGAGPTCDDSGGQPLGKPQDICSGFGDCLAQSEEPCPGAPQCLVPACAGSSCGVEPGPIGIPCDFAGTLDGFCDALGVCAECIADAQCAADEFCDPGTGTCEPACGNGLFDGDETDTDCGGSCAINCDPGEGCLTGADCRSAFCEADFTCDDAHPVFVTATPFLPNWGGAAGGDAICQTLAASVGLSDTFMAWLSDAGSSPSTRFTQSAVPYRSLDGAIVANDWAELTSGTLQNGISIDQNGGSIVGNEVWTGTSPSGTPTGVRCADWTTLSVAVNGDVGQSGRTDPGWTFAFEQFCNRDNVRLYCFQQ